MMTIHDTTKVGVRTLQGPNHAILGVAGGLIVGTYIGAPVGTWLVMGAVGAVGGLLPDIDTRASLLGRFLPNFLRKLSPGHRTITHSLLFCALTFGLAYGVQWLGVTTGQLWPMPPLPYMPLALVAGMLTHLIADGLTVQGIPLFYPLIKYRFKLIGPLSFRTGEPREALVVRLLLSLTIAYLLTPLTVRFADMINLPKVYFIEPGVVIVFVASAIMAAVVLSAYKFSTLPKSKRRTPPKRPVSKPNPRRR